ncbi:Involved in the tonB-independent uptake of proteins [Vibrio sp. B1FLJ16]|uniref:right-handed parallel beta-helix repeat-containing protein n=1 Tax=Vibrio sp. B1FLJ16 TaxID=2751178 RepID=UPI0015F6A0EC|nr:right-handed parallel beta-helix repeat-containing protein [Vibrio sp. B1FLJ16]CAD7802296.1 Involved in the tonB-independent uptake of proteins [Vibrio sp. B1FLJ16]CAE6892195.1 Involved in the tonB-independent uptake of proteins [Vibrio sp. B1FLJ16]
MNANKSERIINTRICLVSFILVYVLFTSYCVSSEHHAENIHVANTVFRYDSQADSSKHQSGDITSRELTPGPGQTSVDGQIYKDLKSAASVIKAGSVVIFGSGIYREGISINHASVTLKGSEGTHFKGAAVQGKATFVVNGNKVVIENIECSEVAVPHKNGACVRQNGRDLTLRYVYFHDSEQGILSAKGSGRLTIENSRFERLGKIGRAHAVYSNNDRLEIRYSRFLSSKGEGHEIKSRSPVTLIESSVVASLSGKDSRLIDVSNGGALIVRNSVLEQGVNSSNLELIGFGLEGMKSGHPQSVTLENNTILAEQPRGNVLLGLPDDDSSISVSIINNDIIAESDIYDEDKHNLIDNNKFFTDRASYGLGPFPELPEIEGLDTP